MDQTLMNRDKRQIFSISAHSKSRDNFIKELNIKKKVKYKYWNEKIEIVKGLSKTFLKCFFYFCFIEYLINLIWKLFINLTLKIDKIIIRKINFSILLELNWSYFLTHSHRSLSISTSENKLVINK